MELIDSWHEARLQKDTKTLIGMSLNLIEQEKQFNPKSPVHTSFVKAASSGILVCLLLFTFTQWLGLNSASCARILDKTPRAVINAKDSSSNRDFINLHLDPIERDKISDKLPMLEKWAKDLELKSGFSLSYSNATLLF